MEKNKIKRNLNMPAFKYGFTFFQTGYEKSMTPGQNREQER